MEFVVARFFRVKLVPRFNVKAEIWKAHAPNPFCEGNSLHRTVAMSQKVSTYFCDFQ